MNSVFNTCLIRKSFLIVLSLVSITNLATAQRSLKNKKVASLEILASESELTIAGTVLKIGVKAKLGNGKETSTVGFLEGKTFWNNFNVEAEGCSFKKGKLSILENASSAANSNLNLKVTSVHYPSVSATLQLKRNFITGIQLKAEEKQNITTNTKISIVLEATYDNDVVRSTKDGLKWSEFTSNTEGGQFSDGSFILSSNIDDFKNHKASVELYSKLSETLNEKLEFDLNYKGDLSFGGHGENGKDGRSGTDGSKGGRGENWNISNKVYCGTNGSKGNTGSNGGDGKNGGNGPDFSVYVSSYNDEVIEAELLQVVIVNLSTNEKFKRLVNPNGGSLSVFTSGGNGGRGGNGGSGGDGGSSNAQDSNGPKCVGGNGGNISIFHTSNVKKYLDTDIIKFSSSAGSSGYAGSHGNRGTGGSSGNGKTSGKRGEDAKNGEDGNHGDSGQPGNIQISVVQQIDWL
ncbi:MAG: hypothetical protein JKY09_00110 [Crocinitomicaceae bacterium]|nr:hypothetical protein [Crocinitomicaceae bacterium]